MASKISTDIVTVLSNAGLINCFDHRNAFNEAEQLIDEELKEIRVGLEPFDVAEKQVQADDYIQRERAIHSVDVMSNEQYYPSGTGYLDLELEDLTALAQLYNQLKTEDSPND